MPDPAALGLPRLHLRRLGSTNERARMLACRGAAHGTLVSADAQTDGRGRQGRTWSAVPARSLAMSLILRDPPSLLALIAGLAVSDAVLACLPEARVAVKWPNDVLLERAVPWDAPARRGKVAGLLIEGRPQERWAVLGIGVNVAVRELDLAPELRHSAASMELEPQSIETVLHAVLEALQRRLEQPTDALLAGWRERDALYGRQVRWAQGSGRAEGIDGDGRLIVTQADGRRDRLDAGEVHLVAPAPAPAGAPTSWPASRRRS